jgi:hypothetical protein
MMRIYNRRFKAIAEARRAAGEGGKRNDGRRVKAYFDLGFAPMHMAMRGVKLWMLAELGMIRLLFKRKKGTAAVSAAGAAASDAP